MDTVFRLSTNSPQPVRTNYVIDAFERFKMLIFEKKLLPTAPRSSTLGQGLDS